MKHPKCSSISPCLFLGIQRFIHSISPLLFNYLISFSFRLILQTFHDPHPPVRLYNLSSEREEYSLPPTRFDLSHFKTNSPTDPILTVSPLIMFLGFRLYTNYSRDSSSVFTHLISLVSSIPHHSFFNP